MIANTVERRLVAILAADVVGYSRLMEASEERTLEVLKLHRREFFDPTVARYDGRIFKVMGDGFLVQFGSVIDAIRCAVDIQRGMPERNEGVPEDRHFKFRIGINLGDVIVDGDDVYGDGVNIAARLEGLAKPGGIACSRAVREQAGNKLDLTFLDQGEHTVKNIERPVRFFSIDLASDVPASASGATARKETRGIPDKPSVAVLPFDNMSSDPEQEFFSDGITEDIITDLSKASGLSVLGRNTVYKYKGEDVHLERVARELGVAYLVEGSVRKAGKRVRITAQLVDGATGRHLWADRYDGTLDDIFALQDEITHKIVDALKVRLLPEEERAIAAAPTQNVDAYTCYLQGRELFWRRRKGDVLLAREMFAKAIELDPTYARAYAGMADCDSYRHATGDRNVLAENILANCDKAIEQDGTLAEPYASRGYALLFFGRPEDAESALQMALERDPNSFEATSYFAILCRSAGRYEEAAELYERASELRIDNFRSLVGLASVYDNLDRQDAAVRAKRRALDRVERVLQMRPDDIDAASMAAVLNAALGKKARAREVIEVVLSAETAPRDRYNIACTCALLGDHIHAIEILEEVIPAWPAVERAYAWDDPDLTSLRGEPRFRALCERLEGEAG